MSEAECKVRKRAEEALGYRIPSMKLVSSRWMSTRMKDISLRVFSKITLGSSDWQRRQLGAMTIARLLTSIFVMVTLAGWANTCGRSQEQACQHLGPSVSGKQQFAMVTEKHRSVCERRPFMTGISVVRLGVCVLPGGSG